VAHVRLNRPDKMNALDRPMFEALVSVGTDLIERADVSAVVLDVHLPDMTGLQLTIKLRAQFPDLPVIFATGDRNVEGAEGLSRSGLVTKPYDYDSLVSLIRSMVSAG
jgi:DNA-binding response OmpR family regulator